MSREIKFRARIVFSGRWAYFGLYNNELLEGEIEEETLGQYTGLKDKNGKEIYEGDVVKDCSHTDLVFAVEWTDGWGYKMPDSFDLEYQYPLSEIECEVIGNVWESPELLK